MKLSFPFSSSLIASALVATLVGCGGTDSVLDGPRTTTLDAGPADAPGEESPVVVDAGTRDAAHDGAATDAAVGPCNILDPSTAAIATMSLVPKEAPDPAGGAIQDGAYALSAIDVYTGPGGLSGPIEADVRWRLEIHGGVAAQAFECTAGCSIPGGVQHLRATITTSGSTVRSSEVCPGSRVHVQSYSATKDSFTFYERNGTGQIVTYTFALVH